MKRKLASLKVLCKWAVREEILAADPFDRLHERIKLPIRLPRALDRLDRELLRVALKHRSSDIDFDVHRCKLAISLLLETGIRVGELASIRIEDVSLANGSILIHGKGRRQRFAYFPQKSLSQSVAKFLARREHLQIASDDLFVTQDGGKVSAAMIRAELRQMSVDAGIERRVTPHMLRHTCATQWLEQGLDIRYVQKLLGHQSISTTEIYTHVSDEGLREALSRTVGGRKR